jgi:hypothetical protein
MLRVNMQVKALVAASTPHARPIDALEKPAVRTFHCLDDKLI